MSMNDTTRLDELLQAYQAGSRNVIETIRSLKESNDPIISASAEMILVELGELES